jgi:hypothetical protein
VNDVATQLAAPDKVLSDVPGQRRFLRFKETKAMLVGKKK